MIENTCVVVGGLIAAYIVGDGDEVNLLPSWQGAQPLLETGSHSLAKSGSNYTFKWMLGAKDQMFFFIQVILWIFYSNWLDSDSECLFQSFKNISEQRGAFLRSNFVSSICLMR